MVTRMAISVAEFVCSSPRWEDCPRGDLPEVAFIGRSNVGKSSLINMLTGRNGLAKVSSTPGKTQLINHFLIDSRWHLVDLPGYGYAQVPGHVRKGFQEMIRGYILHRVNLYCLFLLLDARHDPQRIDVDFLTWLGENGVPTALVFTKCDKLSRERIARNWELYQGVLLEQWETLPPVFHTSSLDGMGREELIGYIESFIGQ